MLDTQEITKRSYEDPKSIRKYASISYSKKPSIPSVIGRFAKRIKGKRIIDIGFSPRYDPYKFANLGLKVF